MAEPCRGRHRLDAELRWQRRELRYVWRRLRRATRPGEGKVFRLVNAGAAPPSALLAEDQHQTATLFCVIIYFGLRGQRSAGAFRRAMADKAAVRALEQSLSEALGVSPAGLEVSDVKGLHVALLDDTEALSPAVESRIAHIASLARPPTSVGSRLNALSRYFAGMTRRMSLTVAMPASEASQQPRDAVPAVPTSTRAQWAATDVHSGMIAEEAAPPAQAGTDVEMADTARLRPDA